MERYALPPDYRARARDDLFSLVPKIAGLKVLDVGCGEGRFGRRLKECGHVVYGIEKDRSAAAKAGAVLDHVYAGDAEEHVFNIRADFFDLIFLGDVLEHLIDPWGFLEKLKRCLARDGAVIASIPNLQYFPVIFQLLRGRFEYQSHGVLDRSHLRFFTVRQVQGLFADAGYEIKGMPVFFPYKKQWVRKLAAILNCLSLGTMRNFLIGQIYVIAGKKDGAV